MSDVDRQRRIAQIKTWEQQRHSFLEIVIMYNSTFGTCHFAEVLAGDALEVRAFKALPSPNTRSIKSFAENLEEIFFG
jgi:hypothetical protein